MDERINALVRAEIFPVLDVNNDFGQVEVEKNEQNKTLSKSQQVLQRFVRIPIGFNNAPGTFQCAMNVT